MELQTDVGGGKAKKGWVQIKDAQSQWKKIVGYVTEIWHSNTKGSVTIRI